MAVRRSLSPFYNTEEERCDYFIHNCLRLTPLLPRSDDNPEDFPQYTQEEVEYCKKVRDSQGFDLDMDPEQMENVHIPFKINPFKIDAEGRTTLNRLVSRALGVLKEIEVTELELEGVIKCNVQHLRGGKRYFITFKAKDSKEYILRVVDGVGVGYEDVFQIEIFRLKPPPPPPPPVFESLTWQRPGPFASQFPPSQPSPPPSVFESTGFFWQRRGPPAFKPPPSN